MAITIVTVTLYRFEPKSLTFKASKRAYGINSYALLFVLILYTLLSLLKPYTFRNPKPITNVAALKGSYVKYL